MTILDVAKAVAPGAGLEMIGIRPGEKLHEQMISLEDAYSTYEYEEYYKILPTINGWSFDEARIKDGKKVPEGFIYSSETNPEWMSIEYLSDWIKQNLPEKFFP